MVNLVYELAAGRADRGVGTVTDEIRRLTGAPYVWGGGASGGAPFVHKFTPSPSYLASLNTILDPAGL